MKRFVKFGLLFGVFGFVLFLGVSVYYEIRIRERDNFFLQYSHFSKSSVAPVVLIVGDSRPALDLRREVLPESLHNFSYPGEGMRQFLLKIEYALATKPQIEYIVLQIDDYVLGEYREFSDRYGNYLSFASIDLVGRFFQTSTAQIARNVMAFFFPLLSHEERQIARRVALNDIVALLTGEASQEHVRLDNCLDMIFSQEMNWQSLSPSARISKVELRASNQYYGKLVTDSMHRSLKEIFAIAQQYDVQVIGVRYPAAPEYNNLNGKRDVAEVRRIMADLPFYAVFDFRHLYQDNPSYFVDPDHLNRRGARIFSEAFLRFLRVVTKMDISDPPACENGISRQSLEIATWPYRNRPWFSD